MRPLLLLSILTLAACDDGVVTPGGEPLPNVDGIWAGNVAVAPAPGGVVLGNNTTRPVGYFVIERELATRALWGPCTARTGCPTVAVGERKTVPASQISGVEAGKRDVLVYWWHLVEGRDGALRPDSIRAVPARVGD
ncbi:hypothetical protein [Roseisolibacter sp. H3M3-2]|uniref:hypothetical protein n=1 Tax=Roseisolibacter sp. H3M3-2 TaxID=3031323 RepID=UPI0023DACB44|nr:hypothetical protein [Roseisolibacter sp. H3M3-2]MDF1505523.1 hypothetical protein [Roseisolibacter sp. H3M3-2]